MHYFIDKVNADAMMALHEKRYPYNDNFNKKQFSFFEKAEDDLEPICLLEKDWELMKLDFNEFLLR